VRSEPAVEEQPELSGVHNAVCAALNQDARRSCIRDTAVDAKRYVSYGAVSRSDEDVVERVALGAVNAQRPSAVDGLYTGVTVPSIASTGKSLHACHHGGSPNCSTMPLNAFAASSMDGYRMLRVGVWVMGAG
jgi:hypothetical protein